MAASSPVPAWIDPVLNASLHALVAAPAGRAPAREHWKYSKVERVTALLSGNLTDEPTRLAGDHQPGIHVERNVVPAPDEIRLLGQRTAYCPATACALLGASGIDRIRINKTLQEPLQILATDARRPVLIHVADAVQAHLHDLTTSPSSWLLINLGADTQLDFTGLRTRSTARSDSQWHQRQLVLGPRAALQLQHYCTGTTLNRLDILITLAGAGASADLRGCWMADGQERLDQQWHVEHLAPHTRSTQMQHGIADGKATTTYRGRIYIAADCPDVDASLINRNLAFSASAVCNTKPELEINTDDVRCSHGATVGQLPEDSLFYLQSRGVDREQARTLLAAGFISQCLRGDLEPAARLQLLGLVDSEQDDSETDHE